MQPEAATCVCTCTPYKMLPHAGACTCACTVCACGPLHVPTKACLHIHLYVEACACAQARVLRTSHCMQSACTSQRPRLCVCLRVAGLAQGGVYLWETGLPAQPIPVPTNASPAVRATAAALVRPRRQTIAGRDVLQRFAWNRTQSRATAAALVRPRRQTIAGRDVLERFAWNRTQSRATAAALVRPRRQTIAGRDVLERFAWNRTLKRAANRPYQRCRELHAHGASVLHVLCALHSAKESTTADRP